MGRLTALLKPNGEIRGIVAGDLVRRLIARTVAQQLAPAIECATAHFQHALSGRAGTECIAHVVQALTNADQSSTLLSIDGIRVGVPASHVGGHAQGGGGRFRIAFLSVSRWVNIQLLKRSPADCSSTRGCWLSWATFVSSVLGWTPQEELSHHSVIRVHHGKIRLWNKGSVEPAGVEALIAAARVSNPTAIVWRGDPSLPPSEQGVRILGTPLGHLCVCKLSWAYCPWNMTN